MKNFKIFIIFSIIIFLSSCTYITEQPFIAPDITFQNYKPIVIDVKKIEVINNYNSPMKEPNVEYLFHNKIDLSAKQLIKRRLVAHGGDNILKVIIDDASVIREYLPIDISFLGKFKREPYERLKAKIILHFKLVNSLFPDAIIAKYEVIATRNKTLLEGISLSDRDKAYFQLTEDLMVDLNKGLQKVIRKAFGAKDF